MNELESGLILPLRFYRSKAEQDRYKNHVDGVAFLPENYVHVDCVAFAPFQIALLTSNDNEPAITWKIVCAETEEETNLPVNGASWEQYFDATNQILYVSYLGNDDLSGYADKGMYYFVVSYTELVETFYSDFFYISNCANPDDIHEYRRWANKGDRRKIDTNDLRIT